jgi:3',5'-cyclic-AMP phosphodiesterase
MDRRAFLASTAAAVVLGRVPFRRPLRLAYLTDMHVEPGARPEAGFARALDAVAALGEPPDLIVNGGDAIFTALTRDAHDVAAQFRTFLRILAQGPRIPVMHCVGNHDVWGWGLENAAALTADPRFGKGWALDALELEAPYYLADRGGWRFIVLDSTHPGASFDYQARLDDAQFEWLAGVLASTSREMPVCLVSHIPLVSVAARRWFGAEPSGVEPQVIDEVLLHRDSGRVVELLEAHPNVRLALSGHLHMEERIEFRGVTYLNVGAVSGNWWNAETPDFRGFGPGFATLDLFADGSFQVKRHRLPPG